MEGLIGLLVTFASIVVYGLGIMTLMWWMFDGRLAVGAGFVGIFGTVAAMAVTIFGGGGWVSGIVLIAYISLMLTYPFAETKLAETELRGYNIELIDRAHAELNRRPDNVPAAFQLARSLYNYGMRGHAIVLSEQTLERVTAGSDPLATRPVKDIYRAEFYELKKWKEQSQDPKFFQPVTCPKCKMPNPPGALACQRCQAPYLLEVARLADPRAKVMAKLVLAWGLIAAIVPVSAITGKLLGGGGIAILCVLLGVGLIGLVLWWVFRLAPGETGEVRISA